MRMSLIFAFRFPCCRAASSTTELRPSAGSPASTATPGRAGPAAAPDAACGNPNPGAQAPAPAPDHGPPHEPASAPGVTPAQGQVSVIELAGLALLPASRERLLERGIVSSSQAGERMTDVEPCVASMLLQQHA